jgi:hypothetical protein
VAKCSGKPHLATASFIGTGVRCRCSSSSFSLASTDSASCAPVRPALHCGTSFARASFIRIPEHRSAAASSSCLRTTQAEDAPICQSLVGFQRRKVPRQRRDVRASEGSRQTSKFSSKKLHCAFRDSCRVLLLRFGPIGLCQGLWGCVQCCRVQNPP